MTKPDRTYQQAEAARLFDVTIDMFRRYCAEHGLEGQRSGRVVLYTDRELLDLKAKVQHKKSYQQGLKDGKAELPEDIGDIVLAKERAELAWTQERAEGQRLKNAALRRELAPVAMVQWAISQAGSQIAAVLGTLKGRIKRAQPSLSNAALHEVEQIAVECQNTAAAVRLNWDDFDESDLPRVD